MRRAAADTGPLHYLVLIGEIGIIPTLIDEVLIPPEVRDEMDRPQTPAPVRAWIASPPLWLRVQPSPQLDTAAALARLDPGERAAIALALSVAADVLLIDDRAGVAAACSICRLHLPCSSPRIFGYGRICSTRCSPRLGYTADGWHDYRGVGVMSRPDIF